MWTRKVLNLFMDLFYVVTQILPRTCSKITHRALVIFSFLMHSLNVPCHGVLVFWGELTVWTGKVRIFGHVARLFQTISKDKEVVGAKIPLLKKDRLQVYSSVFDLVLVFEFVLEATRFRELDSPEVGSFNLFERSSSGVRVLFLSILLIKKLELDSQKSVLLAFSAGVPWSQSILFEEASRL